MNRRIILLLVFALNLAAAEFPSQASTILSEKPTNRRQKTALATGNFFGGRNITVASYNVGVFSKYVPNSTGMVADMLGEIGADAVCLQELDSCAARTGGVYQLQALCDSLGGWYGNFSRAIPFGGGSYGIGVALDPHYRVDAEYDVALPQLGGSEARALSIVESRNFVICSVHFDYASPDARTAQAQVVLDTLTALYGNSRKLVVLCGDFNEKPGGCAQTVLGSAFDVVSAPEPSFPSNEPEVCIDYILVMRNRAHYRIAETGVCTGLATGDVTTASDHLPIFARISWRGW